MPSFFTYIIMGDLYMCGICASISDDNQVKNVIEGLKKLEYRGYDSSGIAYIKNNNIETIKKVGEIKVLESAVKKISANIVIGHTRWATHGVVSEENSHPHLSCDKKIAIVHNGIIENYRGLKEKYFLNETFVSETDTEVFANLINIQQGSTIQKLVSASKLVDGSFAIALLAENENAIFVAKRNSPLYVANKQNVSMVASDVSVFAGKFDEFFSLENDEFAKVSKDEIVFYNKYGEKIKKNPKLLNNYEFLNNILNEKYFMLKEIKEQPTCLKKSYFKYFNENILNNFFINKINNFKYFYFISCGTAYHASLLGAKFLETYAKKDCKVSIASEFRYAKRPLHKNCLYVFVSQSGETADTIACAKFVKAFGAKILCITNVEHSTLNSLADFKLPTFAGPECAVASTKAYTAQVFALLCLALKLGSKIESEEKIKRFLLNFDVDVDKFSFDEILNYKKIFFIGREEDYITSLEGCLKLKEIAYINCLGIAAGELKHGTLALVDEETLVIAISTSSELRAKMESNIQEVIARKGKVMLISNLKHSVKVDYLVNLPVAEELFMPIVAIVPLQILAFKTSLKLGYNPDKPRNLAKSVTVE